MGGAIVGLVATMRPISTRRAFIATAGTVGITSIAGCSSILGGMGGDNNNKTTTPESNSKAETKDAPGGPGKSVDTFENVKSNWGVSYGKLSTTKQDVYQGSQSLVLQSKKSAKKTVTKITRSFYPEALDLSSHNLSLAVKVKKPETVKIKAEIIAPADSSKLQSTRYIPKELDDWVRFDIGYTSKKGDPVMNNVAELNIQIGPTPNNKPFTVLIDDLRKVPAASKGKVMFQFDDGHISARDTVYPVFKEKGWSGTVGVIPDAVGADDRITEQHMREMGKNGWDMIGHASELLPKHSREKQRRILQRTKQYLEVKGFKKGANHFIAPYNRVNGTTLELFNELFDSAYLQGGAPNNAKQPSNPGFISRVNGEDIQGTQRIVNMANEFNQLAVIYFHRVGTEYDGFSLDDFRKVADHVGSKEVDVVTPSQLFQSDNGSSNSK